MKFGVGVSPRSKWERYASRGAATPVATQSLQARWPELQSGNEPCREFEDLGNLHKRMAVGIALRKVTSARNVTNVSLLS